MRSTDKNSRSDGDIPSEQQVVPAREFVLSEAALLDDPYATYRDLRACPVSFTSDNDGYWILATYQDVDAAGRDWERFSSAQGVTPRVPEHDRQRLADEAERQQYPGIPIATDPPEHSAYRKLLNPWFTPSAVNKLESSVRAECDRLLQACEGAGIVDFSEAFAVPLAGRVLATLLGVPEEDRAKFQRWSSNGEFANIHRYISETFARNPMDGLFHALNAAVFEGRALTENEKISIGRLLLVAGHETTSSGISHALFRIAIDFDLQDRLRRDPGLIPNAIEEFLRIEPPVQGLWRTTACPVTMGGVEIPKGDQVLLLWGSANHDKEHFHDPESFNMERSPRGHIAFGSGRHQCIGMHLARLEMRVALEEILARFPWLRLAGEPQRRVSAAGSVRGFAKLLLSVDGR